jgi:hypothetical protein
LLLTAPFTRAEARPVDSEAQLWLPVFTQGPIAQPFLYYLEAQPRIGQDNALLLLRPALGLSLTRDFSVWLGQAWIPSWVYDGDPALRGGESRLYQQLLYTPALGPLRLMVRARQEQRFLPATTEVAHRTRLLLRGAHPLGNAGPLSLILWDEAFFHLNSVDAGPRRGFDQNRAFLGVGWKLAPHTTIEAGYLNVFIRRPTAEADTMIHAPTVFTVFNYL